MLKRRHAGLRQGISSQTQKQRVLAVFHNRNDALLDRLVRGSVFAVVRRVARPPSGRGIDAETEKHFVLAAPESFVEPADRRPRSVGEGQDRPVRVARNALRNVDDAFAAWPREHGLDFELLPLPVLIVRGNALGRQCLHVIDA
jgi:hypothetical protein